MFLKNEFIKENYIDILKEKHLLRAMSRLRTSYHPLKIKTGRHCKPPLPRENRLCSVCNVIEDEEHFLVSCKKYEAERLSLIKFVKHKSFKHWNAKDIYVFLMSNKDPIFILNTAIFIQKCLFPT